MQTRTKRICTKMKKRRRVFLKRALEMYEKSATDLPDRAETLNCWHLLAKPGAQRPSASNFRSIESQNEFGKLFSLRIFHKMWYGN